MKLRYTAAIFVLIISAPVFSQYRNRYENHFYFGITYNTNNFNINGLDGRTYIYKAGKHIVWPLPELAPGNAYGLTLGLKNVYPNVIMLINYSRSTHRTNWYGPDFYDLKYSHIQSEALLQVWNIDFRLFLPQESFLQFYVQPGVNFSFLDVKHGSATYVEILGDIFADNYDARHSFWGINCNIGINLNLSRHLIIDAGFLLKYMFIDIEDIEKIRGPVTGYVFQFMYVI
jgi:hypothetical protein